MLAVLSTTAPIFLLIALGFIAVRTRLMPGDAIPGLGRLVMYIAMPALIFSTLTRMEFGEVIDSTYLLVYGLGSALALAAGIGLSMLLFRDSIAAGGVKGIGMAMSNSAFIGYPVLIQVFDDPPTNAFAMGLMVENMLILPLALVLIEYGVGRQNGTTLASAWKSVIIRVMKNPLIIAIVAGLIASALELQLPAVVDQSLGMLAGVAAPIALFVVGGSLVNSSLRGNVSEIGLVVVGKLALHPLMMVLLIWLLPDFDPRLQLAAVLMAAMPMMSIYPIIGGNYGYRNICASTLLVTTVASFVTITLALKLLL
ncbi:AEC family transporter [Marinobacterium rhizophilum]|uniref:AEC family transporter n=1 Tax=Marinobacterium rhizophilum TaxID=420402 RepID=A0ABY5HGL8_9GAMM|nr:AEC family transporter [Marinobacterium rhizophilum]UTW10131.1 AEC family transporter [Marinobacterium rhizophilum]